MPSMNEILVFGVVFGVAFSLAWSIVHRIMDKRRESSGQ